MACSWSARASALFLLLGLAAAACPEGMQLVGDGPRMRRAMLVGKLALGRYANKVCPMLPSIMAGVGLEEYHMSATPYCTDGKAKWHFDPVSFNNPCNDGQMMLGTMTVDTNPVGCKKGWIQPIGKVQASIIPPLEAAELKPLVCPEGYRAVRKEEMKTTIKEALKAHLADRARMLPLLSGGFMQAPGMGEMAAKLLAGMKRWEVVDLSGCISNTATAQKAGIIAQGAVKFVGTQQGQLGNRPMAVGLKISGDFAKACVTWDVDFDLKPLPEESG